MATKKVKNTKPSTKAKPASKKIKAPTKKKTAKKVIDPYSGKRFFRVELAGYGGELIVSKSSDKFVNYWLDEDRKDSLTDHMHAMNDMAMYGDDLDDDTEIPEGFDKNSPEVYKGSGNREYWEFDDIEHETMLSSDYTQYTVSEITIDPRAEYNDGELRWQDKFSNKKNFDWSSKMFTEIENTTKEYSFGNVVVDRELFLYNEKSDLDQPVPVLMMYDSHKGTFGHLIVMTNGEDFDPKKFAISTLDNTMSTSIEYYYYDKMCLSVDTGSMDTWGKGFFSSVGYVEKQEINTNYDALLKEGWKNLEEA